MLPSRERVPAPFYLMDAMRRVESLMRALRRFVLHAVGLSGGR